MYACMYAYVHACVPNLYSNFTVHIFDMSLNKYGCHITNMSHIIIMLNGHTDISILHMYAKTQVTATPTSHVIVMSVPATNMPLKCHIC